MLHAQVVGLHRDCYVFPLTLLVTKVSGSGPDAVFMGVLKPLPQSPDAVRAWVMPAGGFEWQFALLCRSLEQTSATGCNATLTDA